MKELLFVSRMKVKFQGPNDAIERISLENVQLNTTQYRCKYTPMSFTTTKSNVILYNIALTKSMYTQLPENIVLLKLITTSYKRGCQKFAMRAGL